MTIIAFDHRYVVADSMATQGTIRNLRPAEKIIVRENVAFAMSGSVPLFEPMIDWYLSGHKPEGMPKLSDDDHHSTLFVFRDGCATFYKTELPYGETYEPPMAWGVGADIAIGAIDAGANVRKAVEIAIAGSVWLGGPVQVIDLHELQKGKAA